MVDEGWGQSLGKVLSGWIQEHESALNHEVTKDTKEEGCFYICWVVACDDAFVKILADSLHVEIEGYAYLKTFRQWLNIR